MAGDIAILWQRSPSRQKSKERIRYAANFTGYRGHCGVRGNGSRHRDSEKPTREDQRGLFSCRSQSRLVADRIFAYCSQHFHRAVHRDERQRCEVARHCDCQLRMDGSHHARGGRFLLSAQVPAGGGLYDSGVPRIPLQQGGTLVNGVIYVADIRVRDIRSGSVLGGDCRQDAVRGRAPARH